MVFVENNEYSLAYSLYLINEEYEDSISSFNIKNLNESVLTEGVADSIKTFIAKIIEAIRAAVEKFINFVLDIVKKDETWLNENKDIILNKKPKDNKINNYHSYKLDEIKQTKVPQFNESKYMNVKTKADMIAVLFPEYKPNGDEKFVDKVKFELYGGESKDISATELDMVSMYNYCVTYKSIIEAMKAEMEPIKKSNNVVLQLVNRFKTGTPVSTPKTNEKEETSKEESFDFSKTLEYYFNEADEKDTMTIEKDKEGSLPATTSGTDTNKGSDDKEDSNKEKEAIIKFYYNVCGEFLGAKMNVAKDCYKEYMKILRWHVKQYSKVDKKAEEKKEEPKKEEKPATDVNVNDLNDSLNF